MKLNNVVGAALLAVGAVALPISGQAASVVELEISKAPPPPIKVEVAPAPREGFIYEPGHYSWDGQKYNWVDSQFIKQREGHTYTPYVLEQRGEKWRFKAGHWDDD